MTKIKIEIKGADNWYNIYIKKDGIDISKDVSDIIIRIRAGDLPYCSITDEVALSTKRHFIENLKIEFEIDEEMS